MDDPDAPDPFDDQASDDDQANEVSTVHMGDGSYHPPDMLCKHCLHSVTRRTLDDLGAALSEEVINRATTHQVCRKCVTRLRNDQISDLQHAVGREIIEREYEASTEFDHPLVSNLLRLSLRIQRKRQRNEVSDTATDGCMNGISLKKVLTDGTPLEEVYRCEHGELLHESSYQQMINMLAEEDPLLYLGNPMSDLFHANQQPSPAKEQTRTDDTAASTSFVGYISIDPDPDAHCGQALTEPMHLGDATYHAHSMFCSNCLHSLSIDTLHKIRDALTGSPAPPQPIVCPECLQKLEESQISELHVAVWAELAERAYTKVLEGADPEKYSGLAELQHQEESCRRQGVVLDPTRDTWR
ncbi:hypothetical protein HGRIS_012014 [Hohenbuehelia grisea]|uniref:Uncharacterized protein n=1 Tax=Hohenbuehelia grisea TaxID=104357 RepID=A0ABR3IP38_9AGAR